MKRIQSERVLPHACSPDKQRSRHVTAPSDHPVPNKLGLPMLSPKSTIEKQEYPMDSPVNVQLPSMHQRPCTKASSRENKKNGLLEWVSRPLTNASSDRIKRHRSFKTSRQTCDPDPHHLQVFHDHIQRQPSLENLSVTTDGTFMGIDSPSMLSIHSVESDALDGHLAASPPFVPSPLPSEYHHHHHHPLYRTQTQPSRPPSSVNQHLPSITPSKVDKQGRIKKWHSERIKNRQH